MSTHDDPLTAGLPSYNANVSTAQTAYTLAILASQDTFDVASIAAVDADIVGVMLRTVLPTGKPITVPICMVPGYLVPVLSDGAGILAAGDTVGPSSATAGRVQKVLSGGIGKVIIGAQATADSTILIRFAPLGQNASAAQTLAQAYLAGAAPADETLALTAGRGPFFVKNNVSPIGGSLLKVGAGGMSSDKYMDITDNAAQSITSNMVDGSTAIGLKVDTIAAFTDAASRILSLGTAGVEKMALLMGNVWTSTTGRMDFDVGSGARILFNTAVICPTNNLALKLGQASNAWAALTARHIIGNQTAPPGLAAGGGAGTSPSLNIGANSVDICGQISLTTGTAPAALNTTIFTMTFNAAWDIAPTIILTPANANAVALAVASQPFVDQANATTTTWALKGGVSALAGATLYLWNYHVLQGT